MTGSAMKVGELAERTGLTVRTLHHYDEIGLLAPCARTAAGHRLYGAAEVERLHQIASLRWLGLPLDEIRECLARPDYSLEHVLSLHLERLDQQIQKHAQLRATIQSLRDRLRATEGVSVDELTRTIGVIMSYEQYYTPEQLDQLAKRRDVVGQERIEQVQREWHELFAAYAEAMAEGLDPGSEAVRALARRSAALIEEFTGGDAGIRSSLASMYRAEGGEQVMARHGMDVPVGLWEYMGKASLASTEE